MLKKLLAVSIMILFISVSVIPSTGTTDVKQISIQTSSGNTLYVGSSGPNNYTKIQDAIDDASDGDTVFVYDDSSPYYEKLVVDKSINLIGENKYTTIIDGRNSGVVVQVSADWVTISNFTAQNGDTAIAIKTSDSAVVIGNTVRPWDPTGGIGIIIEDSPNAMLNENAVYNARVGIVIEDSDFVLCENNNISKNIYGIFLTRAHKCTIKGNDISNNSKGIHLEYSYRNTVQKNNFLDNEQDAFFMTSFINQWSQNYWNKPRLLPKLIRGNIQLFIEFKWFNFDLRPALKPYDIEV